MKKLVVLLMVTGLVTSASAALLYQQAPHTPGATGGNGLSAFQGSLTGTMYDREIADDFTVPSPGWYVDRVATSWVQFTPGDPAAITGIELIFWNKVGTVPGTIAATATVNTITRTTGPGTYFTRPEQIITADISRVTLPAGAYFVQFQPIVDHNWFWLTSTPTLPIQGHSAALRRGVLDVGSPTWPTAWTNTGPGEPVFGTPYDQAFAIHGEIIPEPASLLLLGLAGVLIRRR